jgi:hypothetical protein
VFVEIPVHKESAPYLVASYKKGMIWIERCFDHGVVRSALLKTPWADVKNATYPEVVRAVRDRGMANSWGNTFPNTIQGTDAARAYLKSYELVETEILTNDGHPWVPAGSAVMVPVDRSYLGIVAMWGDVHTVVVHNPARGMAVLGAW